MGRDFFADGVVPAAQVRDGDLCPKCGNLLEINRGIEIGHVFQLGRKFADALDLKVLDQNGKQVVVTMGSYGVGVSRAVAAIAEQSYDEKGLVWPREIAPIDVHVVAMGKGDQLPEAERMSRELEEAGVTVLLDDRGASFGVAFKDAELLGTPTILVVGKGLADGEVEIRDRKSGDARTVKVADAVNEVLADVRGR
jgi:prolyl-tRNA synthetase